MFRLAHWLFVVPAIVLVLAVPEVRAGGGTKYAFLVGCAKYKPTEFKELPTPDHDIADFRAALLATGFAPENVVALHDTADRRYQPEKTKILHELDLLLDGMQPEDTLIVALSGHGLQYKGDPVSYFVPVDAKLADKKTLIPLNGQPDALYEKIKACKAKKKLMIVNACRNDPTVSLDFAANQIPLADEDRPNEVPEGVAAIYSCSAKQKSYYYPGSKHSLFFEHVIKAWKGDYLQDGDRVTLEMFFNEVTRRTKMDANKKLESLQVPQVVREYNGEWVVCVRKLALAPPPPPPPPPQKKDNPPVTKPNNPPMPKPMIPVPPMPPTTKPQPPMPPKYVPPPAPGVSAQIGNVSDAVIEKVLRSLNTQFQRSTLSGGGSRYSFTLDGLKLRIDNYGNHDIMVAASFPKANLDQLNQFNMRNKFIRAVSYSHNTPNQYTALESNLDCAVGVSEEMIRYFITAYVQDAKNFVKFLNGTPLPSTSLPPPPTGAKVVQLNGDFLEQVLRGLNVQFDRKTGNNLTSYDFNLDGFAVRLTNFGQDLMIDAVFGDANLDALNRYNVDRKFIRAVSYTNNNGGRYTSLEANLDCAAGVTDEMVRHFITTYVQYARHFSDYLGKNR